MKNASQTQGPTRKWPATHGQATYSFTPAPPEMSMLRTHISTLESRIEEQAAIIAALSEKASRDSLTGLLNRRGMEAALAEAIENYKRYNHNGALLMLDINHFKSVNDTHGHAAGDALLRHIAYGMEKCTRTTDNLCRLGGDEFMIYLPEANLSHALTMARRLRLWLEQNPCVWGGKPLNVSLSIGIATMAEAPALPPLIELADARMYRLKQALRNTN
ncbi:MAG: hypothetical protein DI585_02885 [Pseudomonas fluorescens]|nr:MAG: hypothetical protein DI585_02885 [Pseudomonas fluorescens]